MKRALGVLLLLALLSPALPCPAQDQETTKKDPGKPGGTAKAGGVSLAFRGLTAGAANVIARPRRFVPVTAVLQNDGANEVQGKLLVYRTKETPSGTTTEPEQPLFYERAVALPRGAKRTETLYYYCQDGEPDSRLCVSFEGAERSLTVSPRLETHLDKVMVLSLFSGDLDHASRIAGGRVAGPRRDYEVLVKRADALPERPEGYGPIDLVVLSDLDANSLSAAQAKALADWVQGGGDLLVASSGKVAEGLSGLEETVPLLPVTQAPGEAAFETHLRPLEALAPDEGPIDMASVLVRRVVPREGAQIVAGSAETPLIVQGRAGAGQVTYVAFPLAAVAKWPGARTILPLAAHAPREDFDLNPASPPLEEVLLNLSEALRQAEPPSSLLVGPLLILYVALVVPLNYFVLTRLGKRDYAVLSAGAVALVFGAVFYGIGWVYKGSKALVARAAIVDLATAKGPSRIDSMTGFFSTERGVVDGKAPRGASLAPVYERAVVRGATILEPAGGDPTLRAVDLDTWALRRFRSTRLADVGAVTIDLRLEGALLKGTIRNGTRWKIEAPTLFLSGSCLELPEDLLPGKTIEVEGRPGELAKTKLKIADRLLLGHASSYKGKYGDPLLMGRDPFEGNAFARVRATLERRAAAVAAGPEAFPALLAGVVEDDPGGAELEMSGELEVKRSLVLADAAVRGDSAPQAGPAARPPARIQAVALAPRVVRSYGYEPVVGPVGGRSKIIPVPSPGTTAVGYVIYEWRVPASRERPFVAESLVLSWTFGDTPVQDEVGLTYWDWSAGKFRPVRTRDAVLDKTGRFTETDRARARAYFDPETGGIVRMRLEATQELEIERVALEVNGSRVDRP